MAHPDEPWAYWSLGPERTRLKMWKPEWVELSPWGLTLEDTVRLRDGLNHAIAQAEKAKHG